jgi:polar amino acid transport system permease protein
MDKTEDSSKGIVVVRRYLSMLALLGVLGATLYYLIQAQGYDFRWGAVFDFLPALSKGALRTLYISGLGLLISLLLGLIVGLGRLSKIYLVRDLSTVYVEVLRNIPLLVVVLAFYFGFGSIFPKLGAFFWGIMALSVLEAAYIAEIVRSGVGAIHKEQFESAYSMAMNYVQTMRYIILPQAFRNILPALTGQLVILIKDSSLVMVIGILELTLTSRYLLSTTFAALEVYALTALFYFIMCFALTLLSNYMERRFAHAE